MELLKLQDSRKRYNLLLGSKGDFMYDIDCALKLFEDQINMDAFSIGQLESKKWLVEVMEDIQKFKHINWEIVFLLCGWYGTLASMMFYSSLNINKIRSFDIDKNCEKIADFVNKTNTDNNWRFKAVTQDIYDINFQEHSWQCWSNNNKRMSYPITDKPTTIINTSCEHTGISWFENIPKGKLVILQSNDSFEEEGHVNPVADLDDFKYRYSLSEIYYGGQLKLEKFTRFMLIGVK